MLFSKSCEYALRATIYISATSQENRNVSVKEIATEIGSPISFTAKILQQLCKHHIVVSVKGNSGGFRIDTSKRISTIYEVVEAIEGNDFFERCVIGLKNCSDKNPCPMHKHFKKQREELVKIFKQNTIQDLVEPSNKKLFLK